MKVVAGRDLVVGHGDAVLIPSGWWYQVVSLEPAISLTFAGLWHPNACRWFAPVGGGAAR